MKKAQLAILISAAALTACAGRPVEKTAAVSGKGDVKTTPLESTAASRAPSSSTSFTHNGYKTDLAKRISEVNAGKVYGGRPQALLRSVIVIKYFVDANGDLARSEIIRSNHDHETESTALAALRHAAPFPKPASHLLHRGRVEILETWLFNNDGRFQLRTIAQPQMDE